MQQGPLEGIQSAQWLLCGHWCKLTGLTDADARGPSGWRTSGSESNALAAFGPADLELRRAHGAARMLHAHRQDTQKPAREQKDNPMSVRYCGVFFFSTLWSFCCFILFSWLFLSGFVMYGACLSSFADMWWILKLKKSTRNDSNGRFHWFKEIQARQIFQKLFPSLMWPVQSFLKISVFEEITGKHGCVQT